MTAATELSAVAPAPHALSDAEVKAAQASWKRVMNALRRKPAPDRG